MLRRGTAATDPITITCAALEMSIGIVSRRGTRGRSLLISSNMTDVSDIRREQRSPPGEPPRETPRDAPDREEKHDESDELVCHVSIPFLLYPVRLWP